MQKEMKNYVKRIRKELKTLEDFLPCHWSFLGPGSEKKWYGTYDCKPDGSWNRIAEKMLLKFTGSGHPILRGTERGELRSKEGGKTSIHFNGSTRNIGLLLQMVISVNNQLSIYGAVTDVIGDFPVGQKASGKPAALDKQEILTQLLLAEVQANEERQGNLLQEYEQRFEKLSEDQKLSRLCSEAGLRLVEVGQFFFALPSPRGKENQSLRREYTMELEKRVDPKQCTIWPSVLDIKVCKHYGRYSIEV